MSPRAEDRAKLIDSILGKETSWGGGVGVYGADVCALCGTVDTFRGWIMAAYGCHFGRHKEFVCESCREQLIPRGENSISERNRLVGRALENSKSRYCRMCETKMPRHPSWATHRGTVPRICSTCRRMLSNCGISADDQIVEALRLAVRRRFLELLSASELADMAWLVDHMREELESMEDDRLAPDSDSEGGTQITGQIGIYPDPMASRGD